MTDKLPESSLRLGLPSGSMQASTIDLFGRAGYRISVPERSVFPRVDDEQKLVAYRRWHEGGPGDDVMVVANFAHVAREEYRIGFSRRDEDGIVHGVVWPLLGVEDESADIPGQIETVLRACGVGGVIYLDHRFPLEFCDDCGAPMYPSAEGETIHAEMPEGRGEEMPRHLH